MFFKSNSPTRKISRTWTVHACGAGLALAVALGVYQGMYMPWRADADDRVANVARLRKLLAAGDKVTEEHRQLSQRLAALRLAADDAHQRMPSDIAPSKFIEELTQTAGSLGLKVLQCGA